MHWDRTLTVTCRSFVGLNLTSSDTAGRARSPFVVKGVWRDRPQVTLARQKVVSGLTTIYLVHPFVLTPSPATVQLTSLSFYSSQYLPSHGTPRSFLHPETPSPPLDPALAEIIPLSSTPGQCLTSRMSPGPITLTLRRSHTICTSKRRPISPEFSSPRCSTVSEFQPTRPSVDAHLVCSVDSRDPCCSVFPMYGCAA